MSFNKKIIAKNFSRAAKNYDDLAQIQKSAAEKLIDLASPFIKKNSLILDLGCGTSFIAKKLTAYPLPLTAITEVDIAFDMLKSWQDRPKNISAIQADIENLPFKPNSFDVIFSSFSLQWISDFEKNFSHFFSLLKPGGILAISIPLEESLKELAAARIFHFNKLPSKFAIELSLKNSGFGEKKSLSEKIEQNFKNGHEALISLKKIGASYPGNSQKIIAKSQLKEFNSFCLKNSANKNKNITTSWNIFYFIAEKNDR